MIIEMFNGWYFFWLAMAALCTTGLYFLLRNRTVRTQKTVLFCILIFGLLLDILKTHIPPYSVDEARMLRDSWLVNICTANIAMFPVMMFSKKNTVKDYMVFIGIISGLVALVYPQEPMAKVDQLAEQLDIVRFYFHHWMVFAVPLMMALLGHHKVSYRRVFNAPIGLLAVMLFIMLNQIFQAELGYIPLRVGNFLDIGYKNTSYIWGPGVNDAIGNFFAIFTPKVFTIVPEGQYAGETKYWPWFWITVPVFIIVTPLAFLVAMIFDRKTFASDMKFLYFKFFGRFLKRS